MSVTSAPKPNAAYVDRKTHESYSIESPRWCSDFGNPLMLTPLEGIGRNAIDTKKRSLWRYASSFPFEVSHPISLGEGCTPLVEAPWQNARALFKLEWFAPTGSFKDRGASVMLSLLREQGVSSILEDSSGNGGAAIAAYAAAGGMEAKIFVPAETRPAKIAQIRSFGAHIEFIEGGRDATARAALAEATRTFYAGHNWHPFFLQGTKTFAYELWEDLGFEPPDNIIIPTGAGSIALGCDIGFGELLNRNEITKRPRLFAVQPENCAPIHAQFDAETHVFQVSPTIAEGASIAKPIRMGEVVDAVRRSKGATLAIKEEEIKQALDALLGLGLFAEPTAALSAAGLTKLLANGTIRDTETTIVILTGTGLESPAAFEDLAAT